MKIPASVFETSFSEVIATVKSAPPPVVVPVVPKITPALSTPSSPNGLNIKPQYILIGIGIIVATIVIIHLVKKNENSYNRVSYR
jgi:hypothetical protein